MITLARDSQRVARISCDTYDVGWAALTLPQRGIVPELLSVVVSLRVTVTEDLRPVVGVFGGACHAARQKLPLEASASTLPDAQGSLVAVKGVTACHAAFPFNSYATAKVAIHRISCGRSCGQLSVVRRVGTLRLLPSSSSSLLSARSPASRRRFRALVATSMHSVLSLAANAGNVWYPKYTCVGCG